jgi:hypothetical protein
VALVTGAGVLAWPLDQDRARLELIEQLPDVLEHRGNSLGCIGVRIGGRDVAAIEDLPGGVENRPADPLTARVET